MTPLVFTLQMMTRRACWRHSSTQTATRPSNDRRRDRVGPRSTTDRSATFPQLTGREFAILELIAEGLDNATIARRLVLSPKTVRNHVSNVFGKIQAPDRPGAIVLARREGVGT